MGNGWPPPRLLTDNQYNTIKSGDVITSGTYEGCIQVDSTYYWVTPDRSGNWSLQTGEPNEYQCPIGEEVWAYCKDGGDATWNSEEEVWEDGGNSYRWGADAGEPVQVVPV
jgi:hypothetical protein